MENEKKASEVKPAESKIFSISVSAEDAAKLYAAYRGLPDNRQKEIDDGLKLAMAQYQISESDARKLLTFNNLFHSQLEKYVEKAAERIEERYEKAARLLGKSVDEVKKLYPVLE